MSEKKKFTKTTIGFVTQFYEETEDGKFVCTSLDFICGDQVDYEGEDQEPIEVDTTKEVYFGYDMVQPNPPKIHAILAVSGGVASDVLIPDGVTIEIRDYDTEGLDESNSPNLKKDKDGDLYHEMIFENEN